MTVVARGPFAMTFVRCLRTASAPTLIAALAGLLGSRLLRAPIAAVADTAAADAPWLHLAVFTAAMACALTVTAFWPPFAARRAGSDWMLRLQRGPIAGLGAAIAGALAAQFVLALIVVLALGRLLHAPDTAVAHVAVDPPAGALLAHEGHTIALTLPAPIDAVELQLRPIAGPPAGALVPTRLDVFADGVRLPTGTAAPDVAVEQSGELLHLTFPKRRLTTLRIVQTAGNVPLLFNEGSVVAIAADPHPGTWNALIAALAYVVPTFVALALGVLCGRAAAAPTVQVVVASLLFVQTLGGAGPADDTFAGLMRGRWLLADGVFSRSVPSLGAGSLAMIAAMVLHRNRRR